MKSSSLNDNKYIYIYEYVLKNNIRGISVDLWGTLIYDFNDDKKSKLISQYYERVSKLNWEQELQVNSEYFKSIELTGTPLSFEQKIDYILSSENMTIGDFTRNFSKQMEEKEIAVNKDLADLLRFLKQKCFQLVLVSNTGSINAESTRKILQHNDLDFFDIIYLSEEQGVGKPSKQVYEILRPKLIDESKYFIHIGDSTLFDYNFAKRINMSKCFIL